MGFWQELLSFPPPLTSLGIWYEKPLAEKIYQFRVPFLGPIRPVFLLVTGRGGDYSTNWNERK